MGWKSKSSWGVLFFFIQSFIAYAEDTSLEALWKREQEVPGASLSPNLVGHLQGQPVLFVKGILNELAELISCYYRSNIKVVDGLGMASYQIKGPSSWNAVSENSGEIADEVQKIYNQTGRPVVLIAHSKGAAESLYAFLTQPQMAAQIEKLVLIQGAIGGSPIAGDHLNWRLAAMSFFLNPAPESLFYWPGLFSLVPIEAEKNFAFALDRLDEEQKREIAKKVYYVRSDEDAKQVGLGVKIVLKTVGKSLKSALENDGLVQVSSQFLPGLGQDLGVIHHVDHLGFTISGFNSKTDEEREAFTRALFSKVYEKEWSKKLE